MRETHYMQIRHKASVGIGSYDRVPGIGFVFLSSVLRSGHSHAVTRAEAVVLITGHGGDAAALGFQ